MNAPTILRIITYMTASLILIIGVVMLTGFALPANVPVNFRIIVGSMMVLYAIYRIVMITIKTRRKNDDEE